MTLLQPFYASPLIFSWEELVVCQATMGNWSFDKELKPSDKIIFDDMIHYTTVKTTMLNGVNHPSIGIWNEESGFRLIKEFKYGDYKNRLS